MKNREYTGFKMFEGRMTKAMVAVIMAALISVWGIVPSSVVFAEEDASAQTQQDADKGADNAAGVASIGAAHFETLQAAVDAAQEGDVIVLNSDITEYVTITGKVLAIDLNGKTVTAADNNGARSSFLVNGASNVEITNGTITGGLTKSSNDNACFNVNEATASLIDVTFKGNSGKVARAHSGTLELDGCLFTENDNDNNSSGPYILSAYGPNTTVNAINTEFINNDYKGGTIIATLSKQDNVITLEGCDVTGNKVNNTLYVYNYGTIILKDTTVKGNTGAGDTGGVRIHSGSFFMYDSAVYGNTCTGSGYGNDFSVIYNWLEKGEIPLPQDMKDHGVPLTDYELVAPRYGKVIDKPVNSVNGGEQELSVEPKSNNGAFVEYNGQEYESIADAVAAMNGQPGTIRILKDVSIAETIDGFDGLVIDLDGHTLYGKGNKRSTLRINGGNVTVKNGTFADNISSNSAALHYEEASGSVENVRFENNAGKGVYVYHNIKYKATVDETPQSVSITDCEFINNGHGGNGYGVSAIGASVDVEGCKFEGNYRAFRYAQSNILDNPPQVNIDDCTFTDHVGTVIEIYTAMNTDVTFTGCDITDNHMSNDEKHLIYLREVDHYSGTPVISGGDVTFKDCNVNNNTSNESTIVCEAGNKSFIDCLISGNEAARAGAIYAEPTSYLNVIDTVIKDNHVTGYDDKSSSGGIVARAAKYVRVSMGMSGGVLVTGLNPQNIGYYATQLNVEGGAIYNNTNDTPTGARDVYVTDGEGIVYLPVYDEMKDGDYDFTTHELHENDVIIEKNGHDIDTVFIDPINGDDKNSGDNPEKAVKTWNRAAGLLKMHDAKAIYVLNTITFDEDEEVTIDLGGKSVCRHNGFKGELFDIEAGSLNITNTVIDGKTNSAEASLAKVGPDGALTLGEGAVLKNNGLEGAFSPKGGAIYSEGDVTLNDGSLINNNAAFQGGGIMMSGGTLTMNGGTIDDNRSFYTSDLKYTDEDGVTRLKGGTYYGGGVLLVKGAVMNMSGGTISNNNTPGSGGGIAIGCDFSDVDKWTTVLNMSGGTIKDNNAFGSGGGIFIQCNCEATITGGSIIDNVAQSDAAAFAGGGIYVNGYHKDDMEELGIRNGRLYIYDLELGNNTAGAEGGAIAWCGAGSGGVYESEGMVVYDNRSLDADLGSKAYEQLARHYSDADYTVKASDILFSDLYYKHVGNDSNGRPQWDVSRLSELRQPTFLSETMLNGAPFNWKDENGNLIDTETLHNNYHMTRFSTDATASDRDVQESVAMAKVHINGNYSGTNGGGIGCNGDVYIGKNPPKETKEETEEPEEPPKKEEVKGEENKTTAEVKGEEDEPKAKVKGAESNPKSTRTGDSTPLLFVMILLLTAACGAVIPIYRKRRLQ